MNKKIKTMPVKRKYTKRKAASIPIIKAGELDTLQDMCAAFESLPDDAKQRAYTYFMHKYQKFQS